MVCGPWYVVHGMWPMICGPWWVVHAGGWSTVGGPCGWFMMSTVGGPHSTVGGLWWVVHGGWSTVGGPRWVVGTCHKTKP